MTFDRIDTSAEREVAVELLCGDVDKRTLDRVASAIIEYDRRRFAEAKRARLSGEWVSL
jgi:hypothetical protein